MGASRRFPPTVGVVGFDFGTKPAFSVAAAIVGVPLKQQQADDDAPIQYCHDAWGDNLPVLVAGFDDCGGSCYSTGGPGTKAVVGFTGISGGYTAVWDGFDRWTVVVGTLTVQKYIDPDCTVPDGAPVTSDVTLTILCSNDDVLTVSIDGDVNSTDTLFPPTLGGIDLTITNASAGCSPGQGAYVLHIHVSTP